METNEKVIIMNSGISRAMGRIDEAELQCLPIHSTLIQFCFRFYIRNIESAGDFPEFHSK